MATPMTVKMPDPMTAPMPRAVNETGPRVFFNACSGRSDSEISLSIDFVAKICLASALAPAYRRIGAGRSNCILQFRMLYELPLSRDVVCSIFPADYAQQNNLPLALTARSFLDLLLVLAASARARSLRCRRLTCCALYLLAFLCVGDALRICH
jgi:hypothetical protein